MGLFSSIGKFFSRAFGGAGEFLTGKPTKVKGYAQSPTQRYAEQVIRDIINNDTTAIDLKNLSEQQYETLLNLVNNLPTQADTISGQYDPIISKLIGQTDTLQTRVADTYDDVIKQYTSVMQTQLRNKNRALATLGLLNTPMADYTLGEVVKQYQLPIQQAKAQAITRAMFETPKMQADMYRTFKLPFSKAKLDILARQPAQLMGIYNWRTKMQMLPIETKRALISSLLGTSGQPVIQQGTQGAGQALIQGAVSGGISALMASDIRLKENIEDI